MPAITLAPEARELLESYYWRGNIRQLKNIAEQISAVESAREITREILQKYLPEQRASSTEIIKGAASGSGGSSSADSFTSERELLYKVLFDMRSEIGELRRMMSQLLGQEVYNAAPTAPIPPTTVALPPHESNAPIVDFITLDDGEGEYAEEVKEERGVTKADMQRELITRALKRHNGRRKDAAAELFMSERTLYRRIKELGLEEL